MRFERESWRKLYIAESAEHRLMSILARGLRDYLLRLAGEDGVILAATKKPKEDLARLLGATTKETKQLYSGYDELIRIGYLSYEGDRLWITKFVDAQTARSPGAKRQAEFKARHRLQSPGTTGVTLPEALPVTLPGDAPQTLQIDETRRDETRSPNPAAVTDSVAARARRVLENPHDGIYQRPSLWPEVQAICASWSFGMPIKLGDFPPRDSDLRAILEAISAEEFTVTQLIEAGALASRSEYFAGLRKPGPAAFTPAVLRRLFADWAPVAPTMQLPPGVKFGAEGMQ